MKKGTKWKNWSETVLSEPQRIHYPQGIKDIQKVVQTCNEMGKSLRIVGAGHSFTPLVATSDILISLDRMYGIEAIDEENNLVTVWAGTTLKSLSKLLHECGFAMENLGDINEQTIAGAISTGTHGTGAKFGSLSTQIAMLTIVTANGEVMEISPTQHPAYFDAICVSMGMLGVIVKVQLKVVKQHQLMKKSYSLSLNEFFPQLEALRTDNLHFEFFWFPHTRAVQVKTMNSLENEQLNPKKVSPFNSIVMENGALWILSEISRINPKLAKTMSKTCAIGIPAGTEIGHSHKIFNTPRLVKFREMEYCVAQEEMATVLNDIRYVIEKKKIQVHFPIECRYVKADDIWLSPSHKRDSAYIAVHMYKGMPFQEYFDAIEEVFAYYNGRPHWGKMHSLPRERLAALYPKWDDFLHVRTELDPYGVLLNPYLRDLFGIK